MLRHAVGADGQLTSDLVTSATGIIHREFVSLNAVAIDFFPRWVLACAGFNDDAIGFCLRRNGTVAQLALIHLQTAVWSAFRDGLLLGSGREQSAIIAFRW